MGAAVAETGLCACGCGRPTSLARDNDSRLGYVKGQPIRFLVGHARRNKPVTGYRRTTETPSGRATRVHRARAETALGKPLPSGIVVHHADGSKRDDAPLVVCQSEVYHQLLHRRMRVVAAGGNPNTQQLCSRCHLAKGFDDFCRASRSPTGRHNVCRQCSETYMREYRAGRSS